MSALDMLLKQFGEQQVLGFFAVMARIVPLFLVAPFFSSRSMPPRVRGIAAVALTIGLAPVVTKGMHVPESVSGIVTLMGKELLVGFSYAFVLACFFAAVQTAGTFLDFTVGFSFGSLVDPITGNNSALISQMYTMVAVAIFIAIGGDEWMIQGLARTYDIVSIEQMPSIDAMVEGALDAFCQIFVSAIEVAGPIFLAMVITDAAFGMVSRVAPQLNVFSVGFTVKIGVGLVLLGMTFPYVAEWMDGNLQSSVADALRTIKVA
ncbi:MAG: flagellar biosynthetic protein FliR [Solirubrobacteraceae bacterium]|nr:flagellar biosynthetic protein FliR [Solirubrobacteraceae bacterium]